MGRWPWRPTGVSSAFARLDASLGTVIQKFYHRPYFTFATNENPLKVSTGPKDESPFETRCLVANILNYGEWADGCQGTVSAEGISDFPEHIYWITPKENKDTNEAVNKRTLRTTIPKMGTAQSMLAVRSGEGVWLWENASTHANSVEHPMAVGRDYLVNFVLHYRPSGTQIWHFTVKVNPDGTLTLSEEKEGFKEPKGKLSL